LRATPKELFVGGCGGKKWSKQKVGQNSAPSGAKNEFN